MADPLGPPGCPYDPGDAGVSRVIRVGTVTIHRTIGTWPGDYSVGKHRSHDEGTFQHLIGQAPGEWVQFFPCNTFASHAYGANEAGPGIEISGQNDEPLTDWQIDALGQILRWYRDAWGIVPTFTDGDPRVAYDHAPPGGFVTHRNVYSDIPQYTHYDHITADEFQRAIGGDMPLSEADFDRIALIVTGQVMKLAGGENLDHSYVTTRLIEQKIDALTPGTGGGLTADQVRAIVREELNKTTLKG